MPSASVNTATAVNPGALAQHAHRVPRIPPRVVQPPEGSGVPLDLLGLLDAAERAARGEPRVLGRHSPALKLVLEQRQVGMDLSGEIRLGPVRANHVEQPSNESSEGPHARDILMTSLGSQVERKNSSGCLMTPY